jgi:hypothetical protein
MVLKQLQQDVKAWIVLQNGDFAQDSTTNLMAHFRTTLEAWFLVCKQYEDTIKQLCGAFKCFHAELMVCKTLYDDAIKEQEEKIKNGPQAPNPPPPPRSAWTRAWERGLYIVSVVIGIVEVGAGAALGCTNFAIPALGIKGLGCIALGAFGLIDRSGSIAAENRRDPDYLAMREVYNTENKLHIARNHAETTLGELRINQLQKEKGAIDEFQTTKIEPLVHYLQELLGRLQAKANFFDKHHKLFVVSVNQPPQSPFQVQLFLETMVGYSKVDLVAPHTNPLLQRLFTLVNFSSLVPSVLEDEKHNDNDPEVALAALPVTKARPTHTIAPTTRPPTLSILFDPASPPSPTSAVVPLSHSGSMISLTSLTPLSTYECN